MNSRKKNNAFTFLAYLLGMGVVIVFIQSCSLKKDATSGDASSRDRRDSVGGNRDIGISINCELDRDEFSFILEKDISQQIACVDEHIRAFVRVVDPELEGYLSKKSLESFIRVKQPEYIEVIDYLNFFFNLSHLLFGERRGFIKISNLQDLVEVLNLFNKEMVEIYSFLKRSDTRRVYFLHEIARRRITQAARLLSKRILMFFRSSNEVSTRIDLVGLLYTFRTDNTAEALDKIIELLYVKNIIVGGSSTAVSQKELQRFIEKLPFLAHIFFDFFKMKEVIFQKEIHRYTMYLSITDQIEKVVEPTGRAEGVLISDHDLYKTLDMFSSEIGVENILDYMDIIELLKEIFIGSGGNITVNGFFRLLSRVNQVLEKGLIFAHAYDDNRQNMQYPQSLSPRLFPNPYDKNTETRQFQNFNKFVRVVTNYRYFRGSSVAPFFGDAHKRTAQGVIEIGIYESIFNDIFRYYENKMPCDDKRFIIRQFGQTIDRRCHREDNAATLTLAQVEAIIMELREPLVELGIVTMGLEPSTAENATLMTDLFQHQSNGNALVEVKEAVEFALQVITAKSMEGDVISELRKRCTVSFQRINGVRVETFPVTCFRSHFFEILDTSFVNSEGEPFKYGDFLPRLMTYYNQHVGNNQSEELQTFLMRLERFARTCSDEQIPLQSSDVMVMFGGLFNIESTMIRFDRNQTNYISANELDFAYDNHFRPAVEDIVSKINDLADRLNLSKLVFKYLVEYGEIPSASQLGWFRLSNAASRVTADRKAIAGVLAIIKEGSDSQPVTERYCQDIKKQIR